MTKPSELLNQLQEMQAQQAGERVRAAHALRRHFYSLIKAIKEREKCSDVVAKRLAKIEHFDEYAKWQRVATGRKVKKQ